MPSPLRRELYRRLFDRFGKVIITHDGEAMVYTLRDDERRPGRKKLVADLPGEYYRISCPFCNDTRGRLWINHLWGMYMPQVQSKNLWLCCCYNEGCLKSYDNQKRLYDMVFNDVMNGRELYDPLERGERPSKLLTAGVRPPGELVEHLHLLPPDHHANVYLRDRGYDPDWLSRNLGVGYCEVAHEDFKMANDRVIIPIIFRGDYVGWQGRYIGDCPAGTPKYYTMTGMKKTQILYNFDRAKSYPYVVLTEGATKVWSVGDHAVAQLGDKLSGMQAQLLAVNWKTVVVYLDGKAEARSEEAQHSLKGVPQVVRVQLPEDREPGDYTRAQNDEIIKQAARAQGVELPSLVEVL